MNHQDSMKALEEHVSMFQRLGKFTKKESTKKDGYPAIRVVIEDDGGPQSFLVVAVNGKIYEASVVGMEVNPEQTEQFFDSIQFAKKGSDVSSNKLVPIIEGFAKVLADTTRIMNSAKDEASAKVAARDLAQVIAR